MVGMIETMATLAASESAPIEMNGIPLNSLCRGHAAEVMRQWPAESVDLIVTSPPYWTAVAYEAPAAAADSVTLAVALSAARKACSHARVSLLGCARLI